MTILQALEETRKDVNTFAYRGELGLILFSDEGHLSKRDQQEVTLYSRTVVAGKTHIQSCGFADSFSIEQIKDESWQIYVLPPYIQD